MKNKKIIIGSAIGLIFISASVYLYQVSSKEKSEKAHLAEVNKLIVNPYS